MVTSVQLNLDGRRILEHICETKVELGLLQLFSSHPCSATLETRLFIFIWGVVGTWAWTLVQLGYKTVLLICIIVSILASEAISFLPVFAEHKPQVSCYSLR